MGIATIKKNDMVVATAGTSRGRTGKVLDIEPVKGRVLVEGLNLRKKTLRKSTDNPQGGIVDKEAAIAISNLMLYCPECKKGVRVRRTRSGNKPARVCATAGCNHTFDG